MSNVWNQLSASWQVLKAGESVVNPEAWKRGQITVGYLVGFLSSGVVAAKAFGYELPINDEQIGAIASTILFVYGLFNHAATVASTDKIDITGRETVQQVPDTVTETEITKNSGKYVSTGLHTGSETKTATVDPYEAARIRDSQGS